ncbi:MAG: O-antigen polymerase, partial [Bacteroidota bacterium]
MWIPLDNPRPSNILFFIQYYVIFIPSCLIVYNTANPVIKHSEAFNLILLMFIGLSVIQSVYYLPLLKIRYYRLQPELYWFIFFALFILLLAYILYHHVTKFRIANLKEIYNVRSAFADVVKASGSKLGYYSIMWLSGFFLPFCYAIGIFAKRWWFVGIMGIGYILLFGIIGSKSTLFSLIYFPLIYFWLRYFKIRAFPVLGLCLSFLLIIPFILRIIGLEIIEYWYIAVVNFRTFSIPSLLISQFYDYFNYHPYTYLSHVKGLNLLIDYPYTLSLPKMLGIYYYGAPIGANAGFWAGDGLSGFGPIGIVIMSFFCAILFWLLDSITKPYNTYFVIVTLTFIATSFANISLFTMILSGGLGFMLIAFYF